MLKDMRGHMFGELRLGGRKIFDGASIGFGGVSLRSGEVGCHNPCLNRDMPVGWCGTIAPGSEPLSAVCATCSLGSVQLRGVELAAFCASGVSKVVVQSDTTREQ